MSFATEEGSFDASDNSGGATTTEGEANKNDTTEAGAATDDSSADDTEAVSQDEAASVPDDKDIDNNEKDTDKLPDEPTEVTVVDSVVELSEESDAAYDNDAFFTIDAAKDDSADLATEEVSENVTDILSGGGSTAKKQSEIIDTLEDSGLYRAEESGKSKVDVTSKFAYQRLRLIASQEAEINAYGATKAVYFEDSYLLSYDSIEAANQAYDALVSDYGSDAVFIDTPMKLSAGEKGWGTAYMRMDYQKTLEANSGQVTVAVVDSGIQKSHPVFSGKTILQGRDFVNNDNDPADDNGHGTAVSGVIAESTPSNVKILPLKAMDAQGKGSEFDVISAVRYAEEQGADIINMSIGGYMDSNSEMENYDEEFSSYDALIVCSSGNENKNMDDAGVYEFPGELSSTVCVGAITSRKERWNSSNYGQAVDFVAPGSSIMLAEPGGSYSSGSGTSFSSPYTAAAAALVKAGHTDFSKAQIIDYLKTISEDMGEVGKDVYFGNGCPRFPEEPEMEPYVLSEGKVASRTATTAVFSWKMDRELADGARVDINGYKVNPTKDGDTYTYTVTGFNPGRTYSIPMKIVDKTGKTISNIMNVKVGTYYQLSEGKVASRTATTAVFSWKMDRELEDGARVDINGYKVNPTKNEDIYTYTVTGFNPGRTYSIPMKIVDKTGKTISNIMNVKVGTYYQLSEGKVASRTATTAVFSWKMDRELEDGARVDINGYKVNPTKNEDIYTYTVTGFNPGRTYSIPMKIVDKTGKTISNIMNVKVGTYYQLSEGKVASRTATTAVFSWKMDRELEDGARVDINGYKVNPTKNGDTYIYTVTGFNPGRTYSIPMKIVDKTGKTISNIMNVKVGTYYQLSEGKVASRTATTAVFSWKMDRELEDGARVDINGYKVNPTKNGDTYTYKVTGFNPGRTYSIPVKIVDKTGRTISNIMNVKVGRF